MSKNPKFISPKNLPPQLSLLWPLTWWLALDHLHAPDWLRGVVSAIVGVLYAAETWRFFTGESVDLLDWRRADDTNETCE